MRSRLRRIKYRSSLICISRPHLAMWSNLRALKNLEKMILFTAPEYALFDSIYERLGWLGGGLMT